MSVWSWIAAVWLATTVFTTLVFFGARHSRLVYGWLFGEKPATDVYRFTAPQTAAPAAVTRLAA